jgi:serine/threonine-protein kinase
VVVLDIGFVKISCLGNALYPVGTCVPVDRVCATSHYLSPEHVTGARIDARSDVFSLGVVLYEMLTGIAPFPAGTLGELVDVITKKHPRPPSTLNRSIPSGFDYIVARALSKDPDHRYQSARDMAIHLRRWALEGPTFFAVPHTAAPQAQTAVIHAITAAPASAASAPSSGDALPEKPVAGGGLLRTRRQWLRYGIPGALLATSAAWTIWSGSKPAPKRITVSLPSASPKPEASEGSELVPVHDDVAPASGQADVEALSASGPASAGTHVEGRPVAQLKLAVSPWGEIYVDGRKRGVSPPLRQIDLAPGKHRIEIRNTTFPTRRESVEARPHAHLRIKHKFSR